MNKNKIPQKVVDYHLYCIVCTLNVEQFLNSFSLTVTELLLSFFVRYLNEFEFPTIKNAKCFENNYILFVAGTSIWRIQWTIQSIHR